MKTLVILSIMLLSQFAVADDFYCELRVGDTAPLTNYAEYRGRTVEVKVGAFKCSAKIDNELMVTSTVESFSSGQLLTEEVTKKGGSSLIMNTLDEKSGEPVVLLCGCGLM